MRKIISLIISCMLLIGMVGCVNNYILQEEINMFKNINKQEIEVYNTREYCKSFDIEGINVYNYECLDLITFEVVISHKLYHQFLKDVNELGIEEARDKYGISELIEVMTIVNIEQQKIVSDIDKETTVQCRVVTDDYCDTHSSCIISVYKGQVEWNYFK